MGKDESGDDIDDDFISAKSRPKLHRVERLPTKMFKVVAEIK